MAEHQDALLGGEFAAYRNLLLPAVDPAGPNAVRLTVRRRRRRRAATVAAVVVLAIAIPVAGWAAVGRHAPPPAPAKSADPTPSATAPTGTPSPTVSPSSPGVPTGRISRAELLAATLDLPAWSSGAGCPTRDVRLVERTGRAGDVLLSSRGYAYGDVDDDGVPEPVVLLRCLTAKGPYPEQVVVFDRDGEGRVVALGQVFRSDLGRPEWFVSLDVRSDGSVRVDVSDQVQSAGSAPNTLHRQARTYRWNGDRFTQAGGPTAFPSEPPAPDPTARPSSSTALFTVTTTTVVYGAPDADGWRRGSTTITFVNNGAKRLDDVSVRYPADAVDTLEHTLLQGCPLAGGNGKWVYCFPDPVDPGQRGSVVFPFMTKSDGPDHQVTVYVERASKPAGTSVPGTTTTATVTMAFGG
ncbi:hypothetical protein [Micromonospora sp. IBHARD004]|uniref:hypothetical protein n=1 Tax=Micromonospora sp. IBHARD004 TaxID=3457764 RepID=UPI004058B0E8